MKVKIKESDDLKKVKLQSVIDINTALNTMLKTSYKSLNNIKQRKLTSEVSH